jgi:tRNA(Ile)-lysidine synthase
MNETMEQIRSVQEFLEDQVRKYFADVVLKEKQGYEIPEKGYDQIPNVIKPLLLRKVLVQVSGREKDLESVHVNAVRQLFEKQSGRKIDLPYGVQALRVYEGVLLEKKQEIDVLEERNVDLSGGSDEFQWGDKTIRCRILKKSEINANSCEKTYTKWFDYDIIKDNFCFRTRRVGDFIQIHPDGTTQKLKSHFVNEKVLQKERDKVLLVASGSHILWAVGYRQSCGCRVTAETNQILEIQVDEGEGYGNN